MKLIYIMVAMLMISISEMRRSRKVKSRSRNPDELTIQITGALAKSTSLQSRLYYNVGGMNYKEITVDNYAKLGNGFVSSLQEKCKFYCVPSTDCNNVPVARIESANIRHDEQEDVKIEGKSISVFSADLAAVIIDCVEFKN